MYKLGRDILQDTLGVIGCIGLLVPLVPFPDEVPRLERFEHGERRMAFLRFFWYDSTN